MSKLHRIQYCSRSCIPGDPARVLAEIEAILAASRTNNARDGISGALLFSAGCFAQVLEGPGEAVELAFERIQCDARHSDVTVLGSGGIALRDFPDWTMGFAGDDAAPAPFAPIRPARHLSTMGQELMALLNTVVVRETAMLR